MNPTNLQLIEMCVLSAVLMVWGIKTWTLFALRFICTLLLIFVVLSMTEAAMTTPQPPSCTPRASSLASGGSTMATKVLAETLLPGDNIIANMAAMEGGPTGSRIPIGASFNGKGERTGADGFPVVGARGLKLAGTQATPPAFDLKAYQAALGAGNQKEANEIANKHAAAIGAWEQGGNQRLPDRLGQAVLEWAKEEYNVQTTDGPWPVIRPDSIVVKPAYRLEGQPTTFIVQVAPVWGGVAVCEVCGN